MKGILKLKKKICVLFGGNSTEYEISLKSVTSVINNLDKEKYDIIPVGITKDGKWRLYDGDIKDIITDNWYSDSLKKITVNLADGDSSLICTETGEKINIDVAFPVLHGKNGEDGTIQGLFELANIKYVGVGVLCSSVSMDKAYTKIVMKDAGINQADWVTINDFELKDLDEKIKECEEKLGYPMFVKPSNAGSSIGIGKANSKEELKSAVKNAFKFDRRIIIEEFLNGREVECAVIGNRGNVKASCVGEIKAKDGFYDFDEKYSETSTSQIIIPAKFEEGVEEKIRETAIKVFTALDGKGLSRVDFFVDGKNIYLNEINTLPGFTNISMYPKLLMEGGMTYQEILDGVIEIALEK
ncbi:MAG: D-alanine--D-alanine ligase [Ruminococcaceae bacterium]|nr:D-alanine--D-alanine ligase [Oscillospiraceae bacterium]